MSTKIKICGLYRKEDIIYVNEALPDYVGFIIGFPKSHRNVSIEQVKEYKNTLKDEIQAVGVFVDAGVECIMEVAPYLDIIQLHGSEDNGFIEKLRRKLPKKEIWKAFKIRTIGDVEQAIDSIADRVVLDNGYGTGETFDWDLLEHIKKVERSFILAGGMDVSNMQEAIKRFHPFAIDVSSSVERNRCKDKEKIQAVVQLVRNKEGVND